MKTTEANETWNPPITTERLLLAPLGVEDAGELVEVLSDPSLYHYTGGNPPPLEELRRRFGLWAARQSPDGHERWLNWVIRERPSGKALGTLQATVRERSAEIAWVLRVDAQGRGYASEAARAVMGFLRTRGVQTFTAHIRPDHEASARVAAAIGMQPADEWSDGERLWRLAFES